MPFTDTNAVLTPELWDPATQTFTILAPHIMPRTYHSIALCKWLLPPQNQRSCKLVFQTSSSHVLTPHSNARRSHLHRRRRSLRHLRHQPRRRPNLLPLLPLRLRRLPRHPPYHLLRLIHHPCRRRYFHSHYEYGDDELVDYEVWECDAYGQYGSETYCACADGDEWE